jgi:hypothetical protein
MAKPKIFLSSTYYDLKHIRSDIERFIKELGYDPILNEQGGIPYGKEDRLEEYCYKEINNVDILVSIVGGRYGSESKLEKRSVSQIELKTAYELNKQVYIFIEKGVYNEYQFYKANKDKEGIKFTFADNVKIHEFIEYLESLPNNNTIHGFESSYDIINFLKQQWAGLFQRFLAEQTRIKELNVIKGIESTAKTLNQLVTFLTDEKRGTDNAINEILLSNHPAMEQLKNQINVPFRVFFTNQEELENLLKYRGFKSSNSNLPFGDQIWEMYHSDSVYRIIFSENLFNSESKLKVFTKDEWDPNLLRFESEKIIDDDDLPF